MKPCTLLDLGKVSEIATAHFGMDTTLWVRQKLYSPIDKLFYFDENLVLSVEGIGDHKFSIHILGRTNKIKEYKKFVIDVGTWMFDNTKCTCLIAFASANNVRLQRLIGSSGGKRVGVVPDAGGEGVDEIMYVYPIRDRSKLEGR